jgi:hypothetical protein
MVLETNLRSKGGAEIVRGAVVQEHDFIACFNPDAEYAGVELYAAPRIKHSIGVTIDNVADLVIDYAGSHRTTYAKVYEPAFRQREDPHWPRALDLETKQAVQQAQVGAERVRDPAHGDDLRLGAFKVIRHFALKNNMGANVDSEPAAYAEHVEIGLLDSCEVEVCAQVSVVFVVTALGCSGGRNCRKAQRQSTKYCETFHVRTLLPL